MSERTSQSVPIDQIILPPQVRERFDPEAHAGMTATVRERGILVPLLLRRHAGKLYLWDGARRMRAAKAAGLTSVPAIIEEANVQEADVLLAQMILNCQREDLTPMEKAKGIDASMKMMNATASQVAAKLGMSNATVTRLLSLLSLTSDVQTMVQAGEIPASVAYELTKIKDPAEQSQRIAEAIGGTVTRDQLVGARKASGRQSAERASMDAPSRVTAKLPGGKSITVAAPQLNLESFIASLEEMLNRARQARTKGLALDTFRKILLDQASTGN